MQDLHTHKNKSISLPQPDRRQPRRLVRIICRSSKLINCQSYGWSWIAHDGASRILARQDGEFPHPVAPALALRFARLKAQAWQIKHNARNAVVIERASPRK